MYILNVRDIFAIKFNLPKLKKSIFIFFNIGKCLKNPCYSPISQILTLLSS